MADFIDELFAEEKAARRELAKWAKNNARRDEVVRNAIAAGVDWRSVTDITGIARSTISRIIRNADDR